jgi:Sigma-70 region 2
VAEASPSLWTTAGSPLNAGLTLDLPARIGERPAVTDAARTESRDETRWISDARGGDRGAFERLYERYAAMVHGILLSRVPRMDVEDLVQDVFVTVSSADSGTISAPSACPSRGI